MHTGTAYYLFGLAASIAGATIIRVDAGNNGALAFSPDSLTAKVGDVLQFHFHPINHSVVASDFDNPCSPSKSGGFFSGFMPVSSGEASDTFEIVVNTTDPIFFYCAQNVASHCKNGMAGVVNPSSSQTLDKYKSSAKSVSSASTPSNVFGGKVVANSAAPPATSSTSNGGSGNGGGGGGGLYGGSGSSTGSSAASFICLSTGLVVAVSLGVASFIMG